LDGLAKERTQMYAQSRHAVASDTSVRVAVEERLKFRFSTARLISTACGCYAVDIFQPHFNRFNRSSTVPGSLWRTSGDPEGAWQPPAPDQCLVSFLFLQVWVRSYKGYKENAFSQEVRLLACS